ncbi:MAG TPA: SBBP repeat-containing protein, partial [Acidimicrobiales bacterium]|nr:SBBP repeat-containing protein [Acidimicrobiales bacterium]
MSRSRLVSGVTLAVCAGLATLRGPMPWQSSADGGRPQGVISQPNGVGSDSEASRALARLPLAFEANVGQSDSQVRFLARAPGMGVFLTTTQAVLSLRPSTDSSTGAAVRLVPLGADPGAEAVGLEPLEGKVNYIRGRDPAAWHTDVPTYGKVAQRGVYPGVDLVYYGTGGELEYDVVVAPGADASAVRLGVEGGDSLEVDERGNLVVDTAAGPLLQRRPVAYQQIVDERRPVTAEYVIAGPAEVAVRLGPYDRSVPLVIDPVLAYSTYLGGRSDDLGTAVAVDANGAAFVTGITASADFPTTPGAFDTTHNGGNDAFVAKLDPAGTSLVYSTYLGGTGHDSGRDIALDASGGAHVTGDTGSADFPTTAGAFD